jgi:serine protease Do
MMRQIVISIIVTLLTAFLLCVLFLVWLQTNPQAAAAILNPILASVPSPDSRYSTETAVVETVKKANPAVVAITVSKNVPTYERYYRNLPSPFEDFFGGEFLIPQLRQNGTEKLEIGGGSGFLVTPNGYIVTNRHVVDDEHAEYTVFTNDGKSYPAEVITRDPSLDLAIIKIDAADLPFLPLGNSDALQIGQTVIAIGNALAEFRNTVSTGIVSGLSRSIVALDGDGQPEALDQLIQTDAAINEGNSGGPLLNLSGEVIGINVAIASGAENIGFALSANTVKNIVESLKDKP